MELPLLVPVDALHPHSPEQGLPLFGRVGVQEASFLQVSIADLGIHVQLFVWNLVNSESVRFFWIHGAVGSQLERMGGKKWIFRVMEDLNEVICYILD